MTWAEEGLKTANLGDKRLNNRLTRCSAREIQAYLSKAIRYGQSRKRLPQISGCPWQCNRDLLACPVKDP